MKLELKHLAPYLPYALKAHSSITEIYSSTNIWTLEGIVRENVYLSELTYPTDIFAIKPIFRPMSDFDKIENDFELSTDFENSYFTGSLAEVAFINTSDRTYLSDMLTVSSFLFENHFDVFGLIESGLAIDINTIKY
jgi:hypothetical protein